jgi:hypothetical protein
LCIPEAPSQKYYNNKEHRAALKAFLDDMVKALDESTAETNSKAEIKTTILYHITNKL